MKIYLATDHKGFELKEFLKEQLTKEGYDIEDCGAFQFDPNDDYPDLIKLAAQKVSQNKDSFGIILGKSGTGEAIVANKIKGIRAVVAFSEENVRLSREHNNANIISLGAQFISNEEAVSFIKLFINTPFSNEERHIRRIEEISQIEQNE